MIKIKITKTTTRRPMTTIRTLQSYAERLLEDMKYFESHPEHLTAQRVRTLIRDVAVEYAQSLVK